MSIYIVTNVIGCDPHSWSFSRREDAIEHAVTIAKEQGDNEEALIRKDLSENNCTFPTSNVSVHLQESELDDRGTKDSRGEPINPHKLMVLDTHGYRHKYEHRDDDVSRVLDADWWEIDGHQGIILVKADAQAPCSDPEDCGVKWTGETIHYISSGLHRWNEEDGFYHA